MKLDDSEVNRDIFGQSCGNCTHYQGKQSCTAFPAGIPNDIFLGKVIHDHPVPGDHGILFEPKNRTPAVHNTVDFRQD